MYTQSFYSGDKFNKSEMSYRYSLCVPDNRKNTFYYNAKTTYLVSIQVYIQHQVPKAW